MDARVPLMRTWLYRFYSHDGLLIYVGVTWDFDSRLAQHRRRGWWPEVDHWTLEGFPDRAEALAAEARAIRDEDPVFNVARPAVGVA